MPIICVSMELGALSKEVTQGVSRELGVRPVYPELLDGAARRMGAPFERIKNVVEGRAGHLAQRQLPEEDLKIFVGAEITAVAAQDNVAFRGWGAEQLFRTIPQVASIRVTAPFEHRVRNLMEQLDCDDRDEIVRAMKRSDAAYASALYRSGPDHEAHHLVVNTERCTIEHSVQQIVALLDHPQFRQTEESLKMMTDIALEAAVKAALRHTEATSTTDVWVRAVDGSVWLEGMVDTDEQRSAVAAVAASQTGVERVYNMLRPMKEKQHFVRIAANF